MSGSIDPEPGDRLASEGVPQAGSSYRLDVASRTLWRGPIPIPLRAKTLGVLRLLVSRSGLVVSVEEMRDQVWGKTHSNAHGPKQCIRELRRLFEDAAERPLFIETVGRLGYRFIGDVLIVEAKDASSAGAGSQDGLLCLGRDLELGQLAEGLAKAKKGLRVVHLLGGEAGAGKTRLVDRFILGLSSQQDLWIECGQCVPNSGSREPYGPLLQVLTQLVESGSVPRLQQLLRDFAPSWLVQMPSVFAASEITGKQVELAGAAPERMLRELINVLERSTLQAPGIVVLEDLQWADASTLAWLSAWGLRRAPSRLMIIGTYRSDETGPGDSPLSLALRELPRSPGFRRVELAGLSVEAIRDLLNTRFPNHDFPEALALDLAGRTEGHALFVAEVIEDWLARGCVTRVQGRWALQSEATELLDALPGSVLDIVRHHIARLADSERHLLEAASIAGLAFSAAALADDASDIEACEQRCEDLARRGMFIHRSSPVHWPDGTVATSYEFRHALYQQALYHEIPAATRQGRHRRIGARLEAAYGENATDIAALLAHHFEHAQDHARASLYRRQSGEAALSRGASRDAVSQLRLALELNETCPDGPERARAELLTLMSLGTALIVSEGFATVELSAIYERASLLSGQLSDAATLVPALCGLWNYHLTRADFEAAKELVDRLNVITTNETSDVVFMASQNAAGITHWFTGHPSLAKVHVENVSARYDIQRHSTLSATFGEDPGVVCHQYGAIVHQLLGSSELADRHFQDGMAIARALNQPFGLAQMLWCGAVIAREKGAVAEVRERATELIRTCDAADTKFWLPGGHILAGWAAVADGDLSGLEQIQRGMDAWELANVASTRPYSLAIYAEACGWCGHPAKGLAALAEAGRIAEATGERWYQAELHRLSGELVLIEDDYRIDRAVQAFGHAVQVARQQQARHLELRAAIRLEQISQR